MSRPRFTQRGALKKHDYSGRCIYHVTVVVSDRLPLLGWLDAQGWETNEAGRETTSKNYGNNSIYRREVPEKWMVRLCHSDLGETAGCFAIQPWHGGTPCLLVVWKV